MTTLVLPDTVSALLTAEQTLALAKGQALLSWAVPLKADDYVAVEVGSLTITVQGEPWFEIPLFVNTPRPAALPQWPRALSLKPDLSDRTN